MTNVTEAAIAEDVLDVDDDAEMVELVKLYNAAKRAEDEAKAVVADVKEKLEKGFAERGIAEKAKLRVDGEVIISRTMGVNTSFDREMLYRLAPHAAEKSLRKTPYFRFNLPRIRG